MEIEYSGQRHYELGERRRVLNGGKPTDLGILLIRGSLLLCTPTVINISRKGKMTNNLKHREYVFKVAIVFVVY